MPQEPLKNQRSDETVPPSSMLPSFRVQKPGDGSKTQVPELEKTSWMTTVVSKVGQGAMALGENVFQMFSGNKAAQSHSAIKGTVGLGALQELQTRSEQEAGDARNAKDDEQYHQSLTEVAETAATAEEGIKQSESGGGTMTEQGRGSLDQTYSNQQEERRRQHRSEGRAAAGVATTAGQKKKESFMWKILDLTPGFGEVSLLRKVPKVLENLF